MAISEIDPRMFSPCATSSEQCELSSRGVRGYWARVWLQLRSNKQAFAALLIIVALLLFAIVGPSLWRLDPVEQNVGLISQAPSWRASEAVIVVPRPWRPEPLAPVSAKEFDVQLSAATTATVNLQWPAVPQAAHYQVYRHQREPIDDSDLGLPLGETLAAQAYFEDRLQLEQRRYYYTVVALSAKQTILASASIAAQPRLAISLFDAQLRGFVPVGGEPVTWSERTVTLPAHPFGTDYLGRDMLARLMHGARTSLFIGVVAPLTFILFGALYGAIAGYNGGRVDNIMMRASDLVIALPFLLFMILLKVAFGFGPGDSGIVPMLVALMLLSWPSSARLVRAEVLKLRSQPYISAARLMGANAPYLILRHFTPHALPVMLVAFTFAVPAAIFTEAFLSFIGIGVVPPTPSWGSMSFDGIKSLRAHPHELLFPALFISLTVLAFNLFGDGLRDAMDVKSSDV
ncbi:MAG: ABC transporter permease subunit [Pseudomonadales bacterium]